MKYPLYLFLTLAALSLPAAAQDGTMPFRARLSTAVLDSFRYSDQGIAFPIWDEATDASASAEGFSVELEDLAATPAATSTSGITTSSGFSPPACCWGCPPGSEMPPPFSGGAISSFCSPWFWGALCGPAICSPSLCPGWAC